MEQEGNGGETVLSEALWSGDQVQDDLSYISSFRGRLWAPCSSRLYFIVLFFGIRHKSLPLTHDAVPTELDLLGSDGGSDRAARARLLQLHGVSQRNTPAADEDLGFYPRLVPTLPPVALLTKQTLRLQKAAAHSGGWGRGGMQRLGEGWEGVGGWVMGVQGSR